LDFINNRGKKIGSLTTAVSNDKIVTTNRVHNVTTITTITTIDRNRVRRPRRHFTVIRCLGIRLNSTPATSWLGDR
jgi:hypothetical protein